MVALGEAHKKPKQTRINLAQMIIDQKRLFPFVADDINEVAAILIDLVADGIERAAQAVGPVAGAELAPLLGVPDKNKIAMLGGGVFDRRCVAVGLSLRRRLLVRAADLAADMGSSARGLERVGIIGVFIAARKNRRRRKLYQLSPQRANRRAPTDDERTMKNGEPRHFLRIEDFAARELRRVLARAVEIKKARASMRRRR